MGVMNIGRYIVMFALGVAISGCATVEKYQSSAGLDVKLPGQCMTWVAYNSNKKNIPTGTEEQMEPFNHMCDMAQKEVQEDLSRNVFNGQPGPSWQVLVEIVKFESIGMPSLTLRTGVEVVFKKNKVVVETISGEGEAGPRVVVNKDSRVVLGTNAILAAMESVKRELNARMAKAREDAMRVRDDGPSTPGALNIAVSELEPQNVSAGDAAVIADLLRAELVKNGTFNVVEKANMQKILAEQAFQNTGCTSQDCAVKLGKVLNVQRIVVGSFGKLIGTYFVNIRVVNVETGKVVFADSVKAAAIDDIETGLRELSIRMAR